MSYLQKLLSSKTQEFKRKIKIFDCVTHLHTKNLKKKNTASVFHHLDHNQAITMKNIDSGSISFYDTCQEKGGICWCTCKCAIPWSTIVQENRENQPNPLKMSVNDNPLKRSCSLHQIDAKHPILSKIKICAPGTSLQIQELSSNHITCRHKNLAFVSFT